MPSDDVAAAAADDNDDDDDDDNDDYACHGTGDNYVEVVSEETALEGLFARRGRACDRRRLAWRGGVGQGGAQVPKISQGPFFKT